MLVPTFFLIHIIEVYNPLSLPPVMNFGDFPLFSMETPSGSGLLW